MLNRLSTLGVIALPLLAGSCVSVTDLSPKAVPVGGTPTAPQPSNLNPEVAGLTPAERQQLFLEWAVHNHALFFTTSQGYVNVIVDGDKFNATQTTLQPKRHYYYVIPKDECRTSVTYRGNVKDKWTPERVMDLPGGIYLEQGTRSHLLARGANNATNGIIFGPNVSETWGLRNFWNTAPDVDYTIEMYIPQDNPHITVKVKMPDGSWKTIPPAGTGLRAEFPLKCGAVTEMKAEVSGSATSVITENVDVMLMPPGGPPAFTAVFPVKWVPNPG